MATDRTCRTPSGCAATQPIVVSRAPRRTGALVVGSGPPQALAIVRSLGRRGVPAWVLCRPRDAVARASRHAQRHLGWPAGERAAVEFLIRLADDGLAGWVVFPTDDESAALLARNHEELGRRLRLTVPPWERMRWAYDKRLTYGLAKDLGIAHPRTVVVRDAGELESLDWSFPLVLKPAYKERLNPLTHDRAWPAWSRAELIERYRSATAYVEPGEILVQELVPGGGESQFSYAALCDDGRPLASLTARRTRQYPVDFGRSSSFVETVRDPGIADAATRLLEAMHWSGPAELEFKRDPRDGVFKLLDVNPRAWTWLALCSGAGVDFPYLAWLWACGAPVPTLEAPVGVRWARLSTDVPTAALRILRRDLAVRSYVRSLRPPLQLCILDADDPAPAVLAVPLAAYRLTRRSLTLRRALSRARGRGSVPARDTNQR